MVACTAAAALASATACAQAAACASAAACGSAAASASTSTTTCALARISSPISLRSSSSIALPISSRSSALISVRSSAFSAGIGRFGVRLGVPPARPGVACPPGVPPAKRDCIGTNPRERAGVRGGVRGGVVHSACSGCQFGSRRGDAASERLRWSSRDCLCITSSADATFHRDCHSCTSSRSASSSFACASRSALSCFAWPAA